MSKIAWGMGISACLHAFVVGVVVFSPSLEKQVEPKIQPLVVSVNSILEKPQEPEVIKPNPPSLPKEPVVSEELKPKEPNPPKKEEIKPPKKPEPKPNPPKKEEKKPEPKSEPKKQKPAIKPKPKEQESLKKEQSPAPKPQEKTSKDFNMPPIESASVAKNETKKPDNQPAISKQSNINSQPAKTQPKEQTWDKDAYLREITEAIIRYKSYPLRAKKMKMQGEVLVAFDILPDGRILGLDTKKSSGYKYLDSHTLKIVEEASSAFPKPPEKISVKIPVSYRLY